MHLPLGSLQRLVWWRSVMDGFAIGAAFQAGSSVGIAIAPVIGASITLLFLIPHGALGLYLGFFGGFLMYLATSDILPEAHASHPTRLTVMSTIFGVAFIWLVVGLAS